MAGWNTLTVPLDRELPLQVRPGKFLHDDLRVRRRHVDSTEIFDDFQLGLVLVEERNDALSSVCRKELNPAVFPVCAFHEFATALPTLDRQAASLQDLTK